MVFSSLLFAFFFLPAVVILYFFAKDKYRNYLLLIASLLFYSYGEPKFVLVMIGSIIINFLLAILISKEKSLERAKLAKTFLVIDIIANIGILFVFKYLNFSVNILNSIFKNRIPQTSIALPIGISFFTFQALSYVVDVYRGSVKVQKNPFYLALYISFFPQLIAGPIVRYSTIEQQIEKRICTIDSFAEGFKRFMLGFSKKVLLANNLSVVASEIFALKIKSANPLLLWLGAICYSLQIFYDFSGYSDMAIGLGKIFGFDFDENFNYPYISKSVTEFWRRWHISLGQWFRDYIYIPLGGSRTSVLKHIFNMFVVWALTGIWHGANYTFILWGIEYFVLLVIEKYLIKPEKQHNIFIKVFWQIITLLSIIFGWVMFNSVDVKHGIRYCLAMFGKYQTHFVINDQILMYLREYGFYIIWGLVCSTPILKIIDKKIRNKNIAVTILLPVLEGVIFIWAVSFLILGAHNPFIYFNF